MAKTLSIIFAGDGETTFESVKALLNDFVGVTGETEDGYPDWDEDTEVELTYVLQGEQTDGFKAAYEWSGYAGLNYDAIVGPKADYTGQFADDATNCFPKDDVASFVVSRLKRAKEQNKQPYLFVLWGDEDTENPELEDILAAVLEAELPALDLTAGLDEISFREAESTDTVEEDIPADQGTEEVTERSAKPSRTTDEQVVVEHELTEEPDEAQTLVVQTTYPKGAKPTPNLTGLALSGGKQGQSEPYGPTANDFARAFEELARVFRWQADYEQAVRDRNRLDAGLGAPLTAAEVAPPEAAPKRGRGRPRKVDNASETATAAPKRGRGRPRKVEQ